MLKKIFSLITAVYLLGFTKLALAINIQSPGETFRAISGNAGFQTTNTPAQNILVAILMFVLGLMAVLFVTLMIIAGIQWMTAGGNEEKVTKAKARLKNAVIGFIIVIISYSITVFLNNMFTQASY